MKIVFADTFLPSLKKMINRQRWYWKIWEFFKYNLPNLFKNIWTFKKELWYYRPWDWQYSLAMFKRSLEPLAEELRNGNEVEEMRMKRYHKMLEVIKIMDNIGQDNYREQAEQILGKKVNYDHLFDDNEPEQVRATNKEIRDLADKMEKDEWKLLWKILEGQDESTFTPAPEGKDSYDHYSEQKDGSGLPGWWN